MERHRYVNKAFHKFAGKNRLTTENLMTAIADADLGLVYADMGEGLIKQRVARKGEGKSGDTESSLPTA